MEQREELFEQPSRLSAFRYYGSLLLIIATAGLFVLSLIFAML